MDAGAARWVCARCSVSVGRLDGERSTLPGTWMRSNGSTYCLGCSRALAGEAAVEAATEEISCEDRGRLRRDAVIEFELGRDPEAPTRTIARACRTSASAVTRVREARELAAATAGAPTA